MFIQKARGKINGLVKTFRYYPGSMVIVEVRAGKKFTRLSTTRLEEKIHKTKSAGKENK